MDMVKIFHGSLTIEDNTSAGAGNVRFSSSDTDISLSSSSIMSSSSSVSLFSFDGAETTVLPVPSSSSAIANASSSNHCDIQEDLASSKPIANSNDKQSGGHHSISINLTVETEKAKISRFGDAVEDKTKIKVSDSVNFLGNLSNESDQQVVTQASNDDISHEECDNINCSECGVGQSKLSQLDDSIFQMNLKNLAKCENFCEDLEKRKNENSGYVICDLDMETNESTIDEESASGDSALALDNGGNDQENDKDSCGIFSLAKSLSNYEESLTAKASEKMDIEPPTNQDTCLSQTAKQGEEAYHPNRRGCHVHFPSDDKLITGYVFPAVPWKNPNECSTDELIAAYMESCIKYDTTPSEIILSQLRDITDFSVRKEMFSLKGVPIDWKVCETLEMIFKRVQFHTINLESTGLTEQTAMVMFDLLNYYEPCNRLILSSNNQMGIRGWQACGSYLRQSQMLSCLEARHSTIPEYSLSPVFRGVQMCSNLTSLHLQGSVNPGRSLQLLAAGLRSSKSIQDVYIGDNRFNPSDGLQLANLIKDNANLRLIDLRNNNLQDTGATYIFEALAQSSNCGLNTLIIWNNKLTMGSMSMLSKMLKTTKSLETINLGHNSITDEGVYRLKEGLIKNDSLLRIGLQAIKVTCEGVVALAEFIVEHNRLQKLDLRGNRLKTAGLMALSQSLKVNKSVTCVAMDTEEEDAEKVESEENHEDTKKQYIQDILSYTIRNSDIRHQQESPVHSVDMSDALSSSKTCSLTSVSVETLQSSQKAEDQSKLEPEQDAKRDFQIRCQMLESPSVFNPDVPLFPTVGKTCSLEKSGSLSKKDPPSISSSSSSSHPAASNSFSFKTPETEVVAPSAPEIPPASEVSTSSQPTAPLLVQLSPQAPSSSSVLTLAPVVLSAPPPKPLVSKRKFTVSKAILPSLFVKSGGSQQPSVLYTASSDLGHDRRGVSEGQGGHGDAKVRIIGIQSEEKENATPMETLTGDIPDQALAAAPL